MSPIMDLGLLGPAQYIVSRVHGFVINFVIFFLWVVVPNGVGCRRGSTVGNVNWHQVHTLCLLGHFMYLTNSAICRVQLYLFFFPNTVCLWDKIWSDIENTICFPNRTILSIFLSFFSLFFDEWIPTWRIWASSGFLNVSFLYDNCVLPQKISWKNTLYY